MLRNLSEKLRATSKPLPVASPWQKFPVSMMLSWKFLKAGRRRSLSLKILISAHARPKMLNGMPAERKACCHVANAFLSTLELN